MSVILMMNTKRLRKIPLRLVASGVLLQHDCTLVPVRLQHRADMSSCLMSVRLYESTWSPLLCRLHSAVPQ